VVCKAMGADWGGLLGEYLSATPGQTGWSQGLLGPGRIYPVANTPTTPQTTQRTSHNARGNMGLPWYISSLSPVVATYIPPTHRTSCLHGLIIDLLHVPLHLSIQLCLFTFVTLHLQRSGHRYRRQG